MLMLCIAASAQTDTILLQDEQDSGMVIPIEEPQCITVFLSEHDGYLALYQYRWVDGDRVYIVNDINSSSYISPNEGGGMAELKPNEAKVYIHRRKRFFIVD